MNRPEFAAPTRREILKVLTLAPLAAWLAACARALGIQTQPAATPTATPWSLLQPAPTETARPLALEPTPACGDDDDDPTPEQTEGPFFTPSSPERASLLENGLNGTRLLVTGQVLATGCQPVAGALLDFWHCDSDGVYDNEGYTLRGHQFADEQGRYALETILPGVYPGRTRHIHVKVQAPNQPILTTQLYFPDEAANARDGIFDARLVMDMAESGDGLAGAFDFVLEV
ncbi:MAG: intradiol ring-cleavage dioxygenase [Chloroflexi bacterium]|nr:intradiol ring-cleavage dioxygenase [Chloroflexota bacterium]